jgi:hypothetical protein
MNSISADNHASCRYKLLKVLRIIQTLNDRFAGCAESDKPSELESYIKLSIRGCEMNAHHVLGVERIRL